MYLEPLTTSLQGGWAPGKERISCWARRPLGSGFGEQRIEVRGCLGCRTGGGVSCQGHAGSSPKGSPGGRCCPRGMQVAEVGEGPVLQAVWPQKSPGGSPLPGLSGAPTTEGRSYATLPSVGV